MQGNLLQYFVRCVIIMQMLNILNHSNVEPTITRFPFSALHAVRYREKGVSYTFNLLDTKMTDVRRCTFITKASARVRGERCRRRRTICLEYCYYDCSTVRGDWKKILLCSNQMNVLCDSIWRLLGVYSIWFAMASSVESLPQVAMNRSQYCPTRDISSKLV